MWNLPGPGPEITWPTLRRFMQILSSSTPGMLLGAGLGMDSQFRPFATGIVPFAPILDRSIPTSQRADDAQTLVLAAAMARHAAPDAKPVNDAQGVLAGQIFGG